MPPGAVSYIERAADTKLPESLLEGRFCYVLNSRQMGKSSLCMRTMAKLSQEGVKPVFIDITRIGGRNVTCEQWYAGLLSEAGRGLNLKSQFLTYWKDHANQGPMQRFFGALREVALADTEHSVVLFIDEIDSARSLPFDTDEFFAGIRECYNRRVLDPVYKRLTFCLMGVAVPSDLIRDARTTPFNIGERVYLKDFTLEEVLPLAKGLGPRGEELIRRVHHWSGGHPFLTQSLCQALVDNPLTMSEPDVDALVSQEFFMPKSRETNVNLADVGNRVLNGFLDGEDVDQYRADILSTYDKVLRGGRVVDDESSRLTAMLKLSGLMRTEGNELRVRNRIYERVFDRAWVRSNMPGAELRRQRSAFVKGVLRTAALASVVLAVIATLAVIAWNSAREARAAKDALAYELYVANMNLMRQAFEENDAQRLAKLLQETKDSPHRNMEWGYWHSVLNDTPNIIDLPGEMEQAYISGDGKELLVQSFETGNAEVYNAQTLEHIETVPSKSKVEGAICIDNKWLLGMRSAENRFDLLDPTTREVRYTLGTPPGTSAEYPIGTFDGRFCAISARPIGADHTDRVYVKDFLTDKNIGYFECKEGWRLNTAALSNNSKYLVVEEANTTAIDQNASYIQHRKVSTIETSTGRVVDQIPSGGIADNICISKDGSTIAIGRNEGGILVRDVRAKQNLLDVMVTDRVARPIMFSDDNTRLIVACGDGTARVFDLEQRREIAKLIGATHAEISPDGGRVFVSGARVRVYDLDSLPDSKGKKVGPWVDLMMITQEGHVVYQVPHELHYETSDLSANALPTNRTPSLRTVSNGAWVLKRVDDKETNVVNLETGEVLTSIPTQAYNIYTFGIHEGLRQFFVEEQFSEQLKMYDFSGKLLWEFDGKKTPVSSARFTPLGKELVLGFFSGEVLVFDSLSGKELRKFPSVPTSVNEVELSADGRLLAVAVDNTVRVHDFKDPDRFILMEGHSNRVHTANFSPDGSRLVTASRDGSVRLWDVKTGKQVLTLGDRASSVNSALFHPTKNWVYGADDQGRLHLWKLETSN
jgi:WD40 repeat protein